MAQYFFPPNTKPVSIAPSLLDKKRGVGTGELANGDAPHTNGHVNGTNGIVTNGVNGHTNGIHTHTNGDGPKLNGGLAGSHFATKAAYNHTETNSNPPSPDAPYPTFVEIENPTVVPTTLLKQFHYAFLIRHPRYSIPSYYRCCIPPLQDLTGFYNFRPDEAGYVELRRFFDYLRQSGQVGPAIAGQKKAANGVNGHKVDAVDICIIDADDLLDNPEGIMSTFCESVGVPWTPDMLNWNSDEEKEHAKEAFEKWKGFHEDAIHSTDLKPRESVSVSPFSYNTNH